MCLMEGLAAEKGRGAKDTNSANDQSEIGHKCRIHLAL